MHMLGILARGSDAVREGAVHDLLGNGGSGLNGSEGLSPLEVLLLKRALVKLAKSNTN